MHPDHLGPDAWKRLEEIAGYLNFSSGAEDPRFLANLSSLFGLLEARRAEGEAATPGQPHAEPTWRALGNVIQAGLVHLDGSSEAFRQLDQAEAARRLVFDVVLPAYRRHHRDLLFHQSDTFLFQPFFIGRVCEAVLAEGGPWEESERIVSGALVRLNEAHALNGVDDFHDAMRAVTHAAGALGVPVVNFDALAKAQRRVEDEA